MQLLMVALFMVIPITLLLCLATDTVHCRAIVAHLYIITLAAFLLRGLLLLPLFL